MNEKRFDCVRCGKCCYGSIPLTLDDALNNIGSFPLAVIWKFIQKGDKDYQISKQIWGETSYHPKKTAAIQITPTAYIPQKWQCPVLDKNNLCLIQNTKPKRCKTMPFWPYYGDRDQTIMLVPQKGWKCDTSNAAPIIYKDYVVVNRSDLDVERAGIMSGAAELKSYAERMMKYRPEICDLATKGKKIFLLSFFPIIRFNKNRDMGAFINKQLPVLRSFESQAAKDGELNEHRKFYSECIAEMSLNNTAC